MTIVVYRDGVMAADTACWTGDIMVGHRRKIVRSPAGHLAGGAGESTLTERFRAWVCAGCPGDLPDLSGDFNGLLVQPDGTCARVRQSVTPLDAPYYAIGIGEDVAAGALAMGATAEQAVRVAIACHAYCGGDVQVERLKP